MPPKVAQLIMAVFKKQNLLMEGDGVKEARRLPLSSPLRASHAAARRGRRPCRGSPAPPPPPPQVVALCREHFPELATPDAVSFDPDTVEVPPALLRRCAPPPPATRAPMPPPARRDLLLRLPPARRIAAALGATLA